ncbi:MAG: hypothetical protein JXA19_03230 [Anaerolineales bacterium]|nr:hypothetical protein [Anaerolineales bacterium]
MTSIDLQVLPVYRQDGIDHKRIPGLQVSQPSRRASRSRKKDYLILSLHVLQGEILNQQEQQLLQALTDGFYNTQGTVTSALITVSDTLNQYLLKRNSRVKDLSLRITVTLTMLVMRDDTLYVAQAGPGHGLLFTRNNFKYLHNDKDSGRGLGLTQTARVQFSTTELTPGMVLIFTPEIPEGWYQDTFKEINSQALPAVARKLLADAGLNLKAMICTPQPGSGSFQVLHSGGTNLDEMVSTPARPLMEPAPGVGQRFPDDNLAANQDVPRQDEQPHHVQVHSGVEEGAVSAGIHRSKHSPSADRSISSDENSTTHPYLPDNLQPIRRPRPEPVSKKPELKKTITDIFQKIPSVGPFFSELWQRFSEAFKTAYEAVRDFFTRVLPQESLANIPFSVKVFVPIAVPILLIIIGSLVATRVGNNQMYEKNMAYARQAVDFANTNEDAIDKRLYWTTALQYLDVVEKYKSTEDSAVLRQEAQSGIDSLDQITRLEFNSAITGGLPSSANIVKMVASDQNLYLLNSKDGRVIRASLKGDAWEREDFSCGPASSTNSRLVDIDLLSNAVIGETEAGADPYILVGLDDSGYFWFCDPEGTNSSLTPVNPDQDTMGVAQSLTVEDGNIYTFDPSSDAIWIFEGWKVKFRDPPMRFFPKEELGIKGAVDFTVSQDKLFVLYNDGTMATCELEFEVPEESTHALVITECDFPATYTDSRPYRSDSETIPDATFSQIIRTPFPEPAIFLLDRQAQTVYQFSRTLTLAGLFRPDTLVDDKSVTAFTVSEKHSPQRVLFMAYGNEVNFAYLP